ncbi:MAG TPA: DUF2652 domain-containing protein [Acidimicrobiia bacterium]|nr:DUF2652 domain-containing protein [Acidimicrobiia bacterium]
MENQGYLLIADITGYTVYLEESELDHAKGSLTDLLELLIDHTNPPLVVSGLEGDAVLSYALRAGFVNAQTFLESIEDTYVAFRRAIELMVVNNTCRCNACANVSSLDLKFFIHYGTFALQDVGDHQELMGSDVNLIHRLLKNSVTAETDIRAYILCTEAAERALGIEGTSETVIAHTEVVQDFGEVKVWIRDMHPLFEETRDEQRIEYSQDEIVDSDSIVVGMPPEVLWDYLNQSEFRNILTGDSRFEVLNRKDGRVGTGSVYQCYHGKKVVSQVVVEWRPFERLVLRTQLPFSGTPAYVDVDCRLEPMAEGTELTRVFARVSGPALKRLAANLMLKMMKQRNRRDLEHFRDAVEADFAEYQELRGDLSGPITTESISEAAAASLRS